MRLFSGVKKQLDKQARKHVQNQKPLGEKEIDLGLLSLFRFLVIVMIVAMLITLYVGYRLNNYYLMFGSTVPFFVAVFYYRRYAAKRDEIVYKLVKTDAYKKQEDKSDNPNESEKVSVSDESYEPDDSVQ